MWKSPSQTHAFFLNWDIKPWKVKYFSQAVTICFDRSSVLVFQLNTVVFTHTLLVQNILDNGLLLQIKYNEEGDPKRG